MSVARGEACSNMISSGDLTLDRLVEAEARIDFIDGHERKKSATLLWIGALFGLLGFFFAFMIGLLKFLHPTKPFASGYGYFPPTVSEMVHNPEDPCGKCFFAFEFIGACFIFLSWYPLELANVYSGDDDKVFGVSWVVLRQYLPAPGMMLVATVTTTPVAQASLLDWFCISIHLIGAMMMFVGYVIVEGKTVGWGPFESNMKAVMGEAERYHRRWYLHIIAFWLGVFALTQVILGIPGLPICCNDTWGNDRWSTILTDTAHGWVLAIKVVSYVSEVICGLSLIGSHFCIWWHCTERSIDLSENLYDYSKQSSEK